MPKPRKVQRYGWKPDLPDHRDHLYAAPAPFLDALPTSVDLRPHCPAVYDQGQLGSCTANAIGGAFEFNQMKETLPHVSQDGGAQIRDGIKSVATQGACSEDLWPYDITKFADQPPQNCYDNAKSHLVTSYQAVAQNISQMKGCLASGFPFVFGFTVYDGFESQEVASTGVLNMPASGESVVGGHAICCVGYDDASSRLIIRNSWGASWGQAGYFTMPYQYALDANLASDFWTIRSVEGTAKS